MKTIDYINIFLFPIGFGFVALLVFFSSVLFLPIDVSMVTNETLENTKNVFRTMGICLGVMAIAQLVAAFALVNRIGEMMKTKERKSEGDSA